jgi:hypothetical protein
MRDWRRDCCGPEAEMAKKLGRGNREARKPKAVKARVEAPASAFVKSASVPAAAPKRKD